MTGTDPDTSAAHRPDQPAGDNAAPRDVVPFRDAVKAWFAISLQTFGGPAGQIAVMQRHLVDERRWIGQRRFLHALNYCMLLPGPEAQQLAIYVGWPLNGLRGGLVAGTLFVLPGLVALLGLSAGYVGFGDTTVVTSLFTGLAPAVVAIVAQAVWRVGSRALTNRLLVGFAVAAFLALAAFAVPFPVVIAVAAVAGWALHRWRPQLVASGGHGATKADSPEPLISDDALHHDRPTARRAGTILARRPSRLAHARGRRSHADRWRQHLHPAGPVLLRHRRGHLRRCLRGARLCRQRAVEHYARLSAGDMVRGLALAETTPGPLIMVVHFVAFLGAYHHPGPFNPWVAGVLASLLTTWVTFVPRFLLILLGAPYVERLRGNHTLSAALTGITAAVVGVIANLGLYFAVHTLFSRVRKITIGPLHTQLPDLATIRPVPVVIALVATALIFRLKWSVLRVLGICAALGLAAGLIGLPGI